MRGLAIHGFGLIDGQAGVRVDAFTNALIENNVLGSSATSFTDPGAAQRNQAGVYSEGGSNGTVRNNLIGFGRATGVFLAAGSTGWAITGNEIRDSGMDTSNGDGINVNASPTNTATGNLVTGTSSQGIVVIAAGATGNVFTNNTVTGNGVGIPSGLVQSAGIVLRAGAASTVLDRNVIRANYGAGVQVNDGSTGTRMTRNSFALNGTIAARNTAGTTGQIGIDLNAPGDNIDLGTSPFYTLNDPNDADGGGNGLLNFPVLRSATVVGRESGPPGVRAPGIGDRALHRLTRPDGLWRGNDLRHHAHRRGDGSRRHRQQRPVSRRRSGDGQLRPGLVNGIAQGTDTTNRFGFTFPAARRNRRRNAADGDRDLRRRDVGVQRQRDRRHRDGGDADVVRGGALGQGGGSQLADGIGAARTSDSTSTGAPRRRVRGRASTRR